MSLSSPEVLATPRDPRRPRHPRHADRRLPRWAQGALVVAGAFAAAAVAVVQAQPWQSAPTTGVRALVDGPEGLIWIDADSGERAAAVPDDAPEWLDFDVVSDTVVAREQGSDPSVAARVTAYRGAEQPRDVGTADVVVPAQGSELWLVVQGEGHESGTAALTTASGGEASAVFDLPARFDVVGAFGDALVVAEGDFRYRQLALWDVHEQQVVRRFGLVVGVREVTGRRALVTTGCLTSGCTSAVVNLVTGRSIDVRMPSGFTESGAPTLVPGGVAAVVVDSGGSTQIAVGRPGALQSVGTQALAGIHPARGAQTLAAPNGWLAINDDAGDVSLWRHGLDAPAPTVDLAPGERLLAVMES